MYWGFKMKLYTKNTQYTEYMGTVYRSKLEATWAAFFRHRKWDFNYESAYAKQWFPDFSLISHRVNVHVEVKPYSNLGEFHVSGVIDKLQRAVSANHWWMGNTFILLLGSQPKLVTGGYPLIGWVAPAHRVHSDSSSFSECLMAERNGVEDLIIRGETNAGLLTYLDDLNKTPLDKLRRCWFKAQNSRFKAATESDILTVEEKYAANNAVL